MVMPASPHRPWPRLRALLAGIAACAALAAPASAAPIAGSSLDPNVINAQLGMPFPSGSALVAAYVRALSNKTIVAGTCEARKTERRFKPWGDGMVYWSLPASADWTPTGPANQIAGGFVLAPGASVVTPSFCVGIDAPTFRLLGQSPNRGVLRVEVIAENGFVVPAGRITLGTTLGPSPIFLLAATALALRSPEYRTNVQIRFTAESGTVQLDELWIDPFKRV
jgi:hypothetical protein